MDDHYTVHGLRRDGHLWLFGVQEGVHLMLHAVRDDVMWVDGVLYARVTMVVEAASVDEAAQIGRRQMLDADGLLCARCRDGIATEDAPAPYRGQRWCLACLDDGGAPAFAATARASAANHAS